MHEGSALGPTAVAPVHRSGDSLTAAGLQHNMPARSAAEHLRHNGKLGITASNGIMQRLLGSEQCRATLNINIETLSTVPGSVPRSTTRIRSVP